MTAGIVNSGLQATMRLTLVGPSGNQQIVEAVIDTGFNGYLTVPPNLVASLGLERLGRGRAFLADGKVDLFDIYAVTVLWQGKERMVEADAANTMVLLGMALLEGCDLSIRVVRGGHVAVRPIS